MVDSKYLFIEVVDEKGIKYNATIDNIPDAEFYNLILFKEESQSHPTIRVGSKEELRNKLMGALDFTKACVFLDPEVAK